MKKKEGKSDRRQQMLCNIAQSSRDIKIWLIWHTKHMCLRLNVLTWVWRLCNFSKKMYNFTNNSCTGAHNLWPKMLIQLTNIKLCRNDLYVHWSLASSLTGCPVVDWHQLLLMHSLIKIKVWIDIDWFGVIWSNERVIKLSIGLIIYSNATFLSQYSSAKIYSKIIIYQSLSLPFTRPK